MPVASPYGRGMPLSIPHRRALLPFAAVTLFALTLLIAPAPGSVSIVGTRWLAALGSAIPNVELASEIGLALLAATTMSTAAFAWVRHPERRARLLAGAAGVGLAYAASEGLKLLFAQPRPCTRWSIATECPPAGDWSLPSNHATLAFGATVVIAIAVGRWWVTCSALALAALVAAGRVVQGVHYVHDVAMGAVLGLAITTVLIVATVAWQRRSATTRSSSGRR